MGNIINIDEGKLLVASGIQGNWADYRKIMALFEAMKQKNEANILVLNGNLIHGYPGYEDKSVEILDDLIGNSNSDIIAVLGNHEFMHIYHCDISENGQSFVEPFEDKIEANREKYIKFMKQMPYAIRTKGGVLINNSGPNLPMGGFSRPVYKNLVEGIDAFEFMSNLNHDAILECMKKAAREIMEAQYGHKLADDFFDDFSPQIGQVFRITDIGNYLLDVFFNKNELEFRERVYDMMLERFLEVMSWGERAQRLIVTGRIEVPDGFKVIGNKQLRICSSYGARDEDKRLLVVDAAKRYEGFHELGEGLLYLNRK